MGKLKKKKANQIIVSRNGFNVVPFVKSDPTSTNEEIEQKRCSVGRPMSKSVFSNKSTGSSIASTSRRQTVEPLVVESINKYASKSRCSDVTKVNNEDKILSGNEDENWFSDTVSSECDTQSMQSPNFYYYDDEYGNKDPSSFQKSGKRNKSKRQCLEIRVSRRNIGLSVQNLQVMDGDSSNSAENSFINSVMNSTANADSSDSIDEYSMTNDEPSMDTTYQIFQNTSANLLIVVLKGGSEVSFCGKAMIKTLYGTATIMCHKISPSDINLVPVYAPFCSPLPILKCTKFGTEARVRTSVIRQRLSELFGADLQSVNEILAEMEPSSSIVVLKPVFGRYEFKVREINRLFSLPNKKRFLTLYEKFGFAVGPSTKDCVLKYENWQETIKHVTRTLEKTVSEGSEPPRVLVCGDIKLGKSTLVRCLMNSALSVCERVLHFESDPGQCEFTPSGLVSLCQVTQPLLGLPFTHQQTPIVACYVGGKSMEGNPALYSESIKSINSEYETKYPHVPLFINTMGWVENLGLALLVDLIRVVRPNIIIQIESRTLPHLSPEYLESAFGWSTIREDLRFKYELIVVPQAKSHRHNTLVAPHNRELASAYYISAMKDKMCDESESLLSSTPFEVPWKAIALHSCFCELSMMQLLDAMNASWVALCVVGKDLLISDPDAPNHPKTIHFPAINQWIGFGIVRGINYQNESILISTPLTLHKMQMVNALLLGLDDLPISLFLKQGIEGHIPYMTEILTQTEQYKKFSPWSKAKFRKARDILTPDHKQGSQPL